ncbi:MAG: hypothetical protein PVJ50_05215 [Desulfobacterales bacterium]|jgi:hypothetical protein
MLENEKNMPGQTKLLLVDDDKGFADIIVKRMSKQMDSALLLVFLKICVMQDISQFCQGFVKSL